MREVALSLGSNMGDSIATLRGAVADLAAVDGLELIAVSPVYETDPVGGPEQDPFLNAVVIVQTSLTGAQILAATQAVENAWHRERTVRWGPRTLDIDILAIDDEEIADPNLTVPHPRAHERAFVLVPWLDVRPDARVAGHGRVQDLLAATGRSGVRLAADVIDAPAPTGTT